MAALEWVEEFVINGGVLFVVDFDTACINPRLFNEMRAVSGHLSQRSLCELPSIYFFFGPTTLTQMETSMICLWKVVVILISVRMPSPLVSLAYATDAAPIKKIARLVYRAPATIREHLVNMGIPNDGRTMILNCFALF